MGLNAIEHMVNGINHAYKPKNKISRKDFEDFCHGYILDKIRGLEFGRAFCEKFDIFDAMLFYNAVSDKKSYIISNYIK